MEEDKQRRALLTNWDTPNTRWLLDHHSSQHNQNQKYFINSRGKFWSLVRVEICPNKYDFGLVKDDLLWLSLDRYSITSGWFQICYYIYWIDSHGFFLKEAQILRHPQNDASDALSVCGAMRHILHHSLLRRRERPFQHTLIIYQ